MSLIKIGIIGVGFWGKKLLKEYKLHPDTNVVAISDLNVPIEEAGDVVQYQNYRSLLADPNVEVVHIATPSISHYEIARNALTSGKDVLLEKPMTLDSDSAYELIKIAEKNDRVLLVGHIFRFNKCFQKLIELINGGNPPKQAVIRWLDYRKPRPLDILWDLAPHPIDIANMLTHTWPEYVWGYKRAYLGSYSDYANIYMKCGPTDVNIEVSWATPGGKTREVKIYDDEVLYVMPNAHAMKNKLIVYEAGTDKPKEYEIESNTIEGEISHFVGMLWNRDTRYRYNAWNSGLLGAKIISLIERVDAECLSH